MKLKSYIRGFLNITAYIVASWVSQFNESQWFKRGWTLQELLAPQKVEFYDSSFKCFGCTYRVFRRECDSTQLVLTEAITRITGTPTMYLEGHPVRLANIAKRMSWASNRSTTRAEDIAYCLLGIFDVNMPLLYGEGHKAFLRLQKHILEEEDDESIFAWTSSLESPYIAEGMLARSPSAFRVSGNVDVALLSHGLHEKPPLSITNKGIDFSIPKYIDTIPVSVSAGQATPPLGIKLAGYDALQWNRDTQVALVELACSVGVRDITECQHYDLEFKYGRGKAIDRVFVLLGKSENSTGWFRFATTELVIGETRLRPTEEGQIKFKTIRIKEEPWPVHATSRGLLERGKRLVALVQQWMTSESLHERDVKGDKSYHLKG